MKYKLCLLILGAGLMVGSYSLPAEASALPPPSVSNPQEEKETEPEKKKQGQEKPKQQESEKEKKPAPKQPQAGETKPPAGQETKKPASEQKPEDAAKKPATGQKPEGETRPPATQEGEKPSAQPPTEEKPAEPEPAAGAVTPPQPETQEPPPQSQPTEPPAQPQTVAPTQPPPTIEINTPPPQEGGVKLDDLVQVLSQEIGKFRNAFSFWKIVLAIIIIGLAYFANKIIALLLDRIARRRTVRAQILRKAIPFVSFGIGVVTLLVIAGLFTDTSVAIIILVAVFVLAAVFASQQLLRDFLGGLVILFERPFQIGDRIKIGDHCGEVTKIGPRAFHLRAPDGSVVVIPNAEVSRQPIANANPGTMESQVTTELLLPADVDIEEARRIAFEAAAVSPYVYISKPIEVQVDEEYRSELLTKIIVKAYVFDAQYERELRSDTVEHARKGFQQKINGTRDSQNQSLKIERRLKSGRNVA